MAFAEDDLSDEARDARRELANLTAMHLIAESDVNGYTDVLCQES